MGNTPTVNMMFLVLSIVLLQAHLSVQANIDRADYNPEMPYYYCPCSFQEYQDRFGYGYKWADEDPHAWCPCCYYDEWYNDYEGKTFEYAYAYEENPSEEELDAVRSLDRERKERTRTRDTTKKYQSK